MVSASVTKVTMQEGRVLVWKVCVQVGEWINRMWSIHTVGYHSLSKQGIKF